MSRIVYPLVCGIFLFALNATLSAATFADWQAAHFSAEQLADPAISGQFADPEGDGVPNIQEYAFDTDPFAASPEGTLLPDVSGTSQGWKFRQLKSSTDVLYHFQFTDDFINWTTPNTPIEAGAVDAGNVILKTLNDTTGKTFRFYRMKVIVAPGATEQLTAPDGVRKDSLTAFEVRLRWTDNTKVESGFVIERKELGAADFVAIGTTGSDTTSFVDMSAAGGTTYVYRLRAIDGATQSSPSSEIVVTTPDVEIGDLTNSTIQLVTGQIQAATAGFSLAGSTFDMNQPLAWASQPGMLRTWDQSGNPDRVFRLYSASSMVESGTSFDPSAETASLAGWKSSGTASYNALWCDLNSPMATGSGPGSFLVYPVVTPPLVNGSGVTLDAANGVAIDTTSGNTGVQNGIQGFDIENPPGFIGADGPSATNNPAPMPVRWLYLLRNGARVAPVGTGTSATIPGASNTNPIVGRMAFWTDDETCKVNVNTASEGIFWDQPRGTTICERGVGSGYPGPTLGNQPNNVFGFGWSLPFQNEFQRTPGHPAMVCLSTVFGLQMPRPSVINNNTYPQISKYFAATDASGNPFKSRPWPAPRTLDGGSRGGTVISYLDPITGGTVTSGPIQIGQAPLYSTIDDFLFSPDRPAVTGTMTDANLRANRFFLSTESRAPELTLWGTPKVSVWPLFSGTENQSAKDKLFALCSTTGNGSSSKPYYFMRLSPYISGSNLGSAQDSTADISLPRNTQLYDYLDNLLSKNVPGLGGVIGGNANQRHQTLTEIFDYIRVFVNGWKTNVPPAYRYVPINGSGAGSALPMDGPYSTHGFGRTATVKDVTMVFYTADINRDPWFWGAVPPRSPFPSDPLDGTGWPKRIPYTTKIGLALILNPYVISPGAPRVAPTVRFRISGLTSIAVTTNSGTNMPFFTQDQALIGLNDSNSLDSRTSLNGLRGLLTRNFTSGTPRDPRSSDIWTGYRQMISKVTVPTNPVPYDPVLGSPGTFHFEGGTLQIEVLDGFYGNQVIQTIHVNLPAAEFPIPTLRRAEQAKFGSYTYSDAQFTSPGTDDTKPVYYTGMNIDPMDFPQRFDNFRDDYSWPPGYGYQYYLATGIIKRGDTVRSVQINVDTYPFGDMRLVAALKNVPSTFFGARPGQNQYAVSVSSTTAAVPHAHSLVFGRAGFMTLGYRIPFNPDQYPPESFLPDDWNQQYPIRSTVGSVYPGISYSDPAYTKITSHAPYGLTGAYLTGTIPGDWDNGTGNIGDGPFINKTDEAARDNGVYITSPDRTYFPPDAATMVDIGVTFNPNRQIASPVMFGSLPPGIDQVDPANCAPWRTLLFCPNPAAGSAHPGFGVSMSGTGPAATPPFITAPDHAWLDLFWMPIIEPNPSEAFSTAGRVNLNQLIMPFFGHIERTTALRAVLKPLQIAAIPTAAVNDRGQTRAYKDTSTNYALLYGGTGGPYYDFRYAVNLDATIAGFTARYQNGQDAFRSASEVCNIFLVPQRKPDSVYDPVAPVPPASYNIATLQQWWEGMGTGTNNNGFLATGDNTREAPYNHIYPLVTTKSNTYQIHYRVQLLRKRVNSDPSVWEEGPDQVVTESRGSETIERYIDTTNPAIPDYAVQPDATPISTFYKFRSLDSAEFAP